MFLNLSTSGKQFISSILTPDFIEKLLLLEAGSSLEDRGLEVAPLEAAFMFSLLQLEDAIDSMSSIDLKMFCN